LLCLAGVAAAVWFAFGSQVVSTIRGEPQNQARGGSSHSVKAVGVGLLVAFFAFAWLGGKFDPERSEEAVAQRAAKKDADIKYYEAKVLWTEKCMRSWENSNDYYTATSAWNRQQAEERCDASFSSQ
jgi:hypothetical protein